MECLPMTVSTVAELSFPTVGLECQMKIMPKTNANKFPVSTLQISCQRPESNRTEAIPLFAVVAAAVGNLEYSLFIQRIFYLLVR